MSAWEGCCGVSLWYHVIILASIKSRGAVSWRFITGLYRCRPAFKHSKAISSVSILTRRDCTAPPRAESRRITLYPNTSYPWLLPLFSADGIPSRAVPAFCCSPRLAQAGGWVKEATGAGGSRRWRAGAVQLQPSSAGSRADLLVREVSGQGRF